MKIGILRLGSPDQYVIERVVEHLNENLPKTTATFISVNLPVPERALNEERQQYNSDVILDSVRHGVKENKEFDKVLGITDVDVYSPELNFVFGKAECPGTAALISLHRLRPEFYKRNPDTELFVDRATKEAVHELGHTLSLEHCSNPFCVMYFSNSIFETDRKQSLFCNRCHLRAEALMEQQGREQ